MDSQNKISILIVGASGALGSLITKHSLTKPNLIVNIFVRDPQKNKELTAAVEKAGGKVFQGDVTKPETFKGVTKGIHTVIFTLPPFGSDVNVEGQVALIDDCVANGVKRIVPANFTWNFSKYSSEEIASHDLPAGKQKLIDYLKNLPVKTLVIDTGAFLESHLQFSLGKNFEYWGDADQKYQITTYEDAARFTAYAVSSEDLDGYLVVAGYDLSVNDLVAVYNKVKGTNIIPRRLGSLEDLKVKTEELETKGGFEAILLKLLTFFWNEKSQFDKVDTNKFPEFKVTPVEEFLVQRHDI